MVQVLAEMGDDDEKLAVDILYRAITAPIIQIAENAGTEGSLVLEKVPAESQTESASESACRAESASGSGLRNGSPHR